MTKVTHRAEMSAKEYSRILARMLRMSPVIAARVYPPTCHPT